jgi:hypothetical protein
VATIRSWSVCEESRPGWHARAEPRQLGFGELLQVLQVIQLGGDITAGIVKPVPVVVGAMHSEWAAQGIAQFMRSDSVLTRKYFDPLPQSPLLL